MPALYLSLWDALPYLEEVRAAGGTGWPRGSATALGSTPQP